MSNDDELDKDELTKPGNGEEEKRLLDSEGKDETPQEANLKVEAQVEEYEIELKKKYRREGDKQLIKKEKKVFRDRLMERELQDEERDIEDIRKEERFNISTNLILSLVFLGIFIVWAVVFAKGLENISEDIQNFMSKNFGWFYILASSGFLIYLVYLVFSRFGNVVLGDPGEKPEFSNFSWYAMLFSAGMGTGLLFWGGAEPLSHFLYPPVGVGGTAEAARQAMVYTSFHWGFHAWAIYTVAAVGVAYYGFRKRKKYLVSSSVMDVFENRTINRALKIFADLVSTLAVVFGVAASIGMGITSIYKGLNWVYHFDISKTVGYVGILILMTFFFILSASTGLKKGIKILSNVNIIVAIVLMIFVFLVGPKLFILKVFVDSIGQYLGQLFQLSFQIAPFTPKYEQWMGNWTLSWFTWWIAWAPFVGIFIARISKGRTIKELILGSLLVPAVFSILWFAVFGGCALHLEIYTQNGIGTLLQTEGETVALFALLQQYPMPLITSGIAIFLLFTFLVTSADSATFVISMMTTEGDLDPGLGMKILWGVIISVVTLILLISGITNPTADAFSSIKAAVLTFAFPFCLVLILITISVYIRLSRQVKQKRI
ncbi:MAG: BCCT family transporter [Candidatus Eremiobacteraeota bacterium]|nr:BCCT family transporter [Candidatus Eremiobacteraeota bacterium]